MAGLAAGILVRLRDRDRIWHEPLLLKTTTAQMMMEQIGEDTPDGDVYPEEIDASLTLDYDVMEAWRPSRGCRSRADIALAGVVNGFELYSRHELAGGIRRWEGLLAACGRRLAAGGMQGVVDGDTALVYNAAGAVLCADEAGRNPAAGWGSRSGGCCRG